MHQVVPKPTMNDLAASGGESAPERLKLLTTSICSDIIHECYTKRHKSFDSGFAGFPQTSATESPTMQGLLLS
jgi:hypothetical protein